MNGVVDAQAVLDEYKAASWVEGLVVSYAQRRLAEDADAAELLAELDSARDEIDAWIELEQRFGIAEAMKLLGQWIDCWDGTGRLPAVEWAARLAGVSLPGGADADRRREARCAADPIFNLWRPMNPNYGLPKPSRV